mmetsp:Transcript_3699/g.7930  ORF Transcript_3699/g.7930 Transcript_3699/m.7930 type:complete len:323 (-) Transcript_3699:449-1417(-)
MSAPTTTEQAAQSYAFEQLVKHLQMRTDVQNIDVMILAGFCRNCLSKWYHAGLAHHGQFIAYEQACERVYGMPYKEWKGTHQAKASEEQLRRMEETKHMHSKHSPVPSAPAQQTSSLSGPLLSDVCCQPVAQLPLAHAPAPVIPPPAVQVEVRVGILTVSDRAAAGVYGDASGPEVKRCLEIYAATEGAACWTLLLGATALVADEKEHICAKLREWSKPADGGRPLCNLVLTTGGTGLAPRDVTPEATLSVVDRQVPGISEFLLRETMRIEPLAALSRAAVGVRGQTLIVNLPGRPTAVQQNLTVLMPLLSHALLGLEAASA